MLIQQVLQTPLIDRTELVFAHRLATIWNADHIIVLQNETLSEKIDHKELVAADGLYASLYSANNASFDDIPVKDQ